MMRTLGFLGTFAFALGIVALLGSGCPPENDHLKKVIIKALSNDGCRGCESCTPIEGEGEPSEGEPAVEGEGEMPAEGEVSLEGEGEITEGEGEVSPEGEGEITVEGEGEIVEGEAVEGEGEVLPEGEGEPVVEGEGEMLPEGEGEITVEGEGEILEGEAVEGEGEVLPEGEGEPVVEGEGEILLEGEPVLEGEGEILPEGEGEILPEGEGEIIPEGEGELVEGEGESSSITVTIEPAGSITAGAQWFIDDGAPRDSGVTVSGLAPGSHVLSFKVLAGWIKPATQLIELLPGQSVAETFAYTALLKSNDLVVLGYSELGMHCMNEDFSEFMILPPYNTFHAQVIDRSHGSPEIVQSGITLDYYIPGNTTSVTKTNFWTYAEALFGMPLAPDTGLTGSRLSGTLMPSPAPRTDWVVTGIPITPLEDAGPENPYSLAVVTASIGSQNIAQTQAVVPVSWEISCNLCHNTPGISAATDILRKHDQKHETSLESESPVACGECHAQPELGMPGNGTSHNLSRVMHGSHASRMSGISDVACYACHPGIRTQCLRDIHFSKGMTCVSCHGEMTQVASPDRVPWESEPRCETCHVSIAPAGYEFEQPGVLYRNSKGHRNIMCATCHGSPHAITPTVNIEDNVQALFIQNHAGTINTCSVCHSEVPDDPFPHSVYDDDK